MRTDDGTTRGKAIQGDLPNWAPLEATIDEILGSFMWMFEVELDGGLRVQAYKHYFTRVYAHLGEGGRAFAYTHGDRYRELPQPVPFGYDPSMWAVLEAARWPGDEPEALGNVEW